MKKRILSALLAFFVLAADCGSALALELSTSVAVSNVTATAESPAVTSTFMVDDVAVEISEETINGTVYVSLRAVTEQIYPTATVEWVGDYVAVTAPGLEMTVGLDDQYLVANGRYLYMPQGAVVKSGVTMVPLQVLATALGATVSRDPLTGGLVVQSGSPIQSGDSYYNSDSVYWLSRIISAESRGQSLEGQIAVGTVILNRVDSPIYPDTIYDVIFQQNQFSPARNGTIYNTPADQSVVAAKLCLDGAAEAESALYFNQNGLASWASMNRTFLMIIGGHTFYD